ncbi:hypothetical protein CHL78_000935 [Romboutsia weinsteinii]|uniref:Uncharacterized protein n=1 Tax=Romboutsia weinsteinii TaxID=2020949 RepID=A0A371JAT3_9FIRM|nr:hypothetical protein [Romboutsia weinsteinii]RDY29767.1 hypothetical protein CHL78_000935 [Romboutsia weinsteinii]
MKRKLKKVTPYCYKRVFDLTMFNKELLKCYSLEQAKYYYIGSSNIGTRDRNNRWKSHIVARYSIDRNILDFITKYRMFLEEQSDMNAKEIDKLLFNTLEIVSQHQSIENSKIFESDLIGYYQILQATNETRSIKDKIFILNSRGSSVKIKDEKVKFKRKLFLD